MDICEIIRDWIIGILSSYLTWGVAMLAVIYFLVWIIVLLYKHNEYLKVFNKRLSEFHNNSSKIEIEVKSIRFYSAIVAYVVLFACFLAVIHYISHTLPRLTEYGKTQNLGIDYLGLIVAIFAIIVTLLVTWQIFSTIKAKEELRETQREIKSDFESKIKDLDTRLTKLSTQQAKTEGRVEEKQQPNQSISLALPPEIIEFSLAKMAKETSPLYNWLLEVIDGVKTITDILNEYSKVLKKSPNKVKYINGRFATKEEIIALIKEVEPIALMRINAIKGTSK